MPAVQITRLLWVIQPLLSLECWQSLVDLKGLQVTRFFIMGSVVAWQLVLDLDRSCNMMIGLSSLAWALYKPQTPVRLHKVCCRFVV